jgi:hypothetical protein
MGGIDFPKPHAGGSMSWIACDATLFEHPKTGDLMRAMRYSREKTVVGLLRFWCWCLNYAPDGDLRKHTPPNLARAFGIPAEKGEALVIAMIETGWLDADPYFRVHDWWGNNGIFLLGRYKRHPEIWQKIRAQYENDDSGPERLQSRDGAVQDHLTLPDRTIPNQINLINSIDSTGRIPELLRSSSGAL